MQLVSADVEAVNIGLLKRGNTVTFAATFSVSVALRFTSLFFAFVFCLPVYADGSLLAEGSLPAEGSQKLPARLQSAFDYADIPLSSVSLIVQPLGGGGPLLNVNPDTARNPASAIKLVTSYAALEILGPGYRWPTEFYLRGKLANGVLKGDLGVKGYGDPYLVIEDFWKLLRALRREGIEHIEGDLILDATHFADIDEDMGAFDRQPARTYNLTPNALMVNFQTVRFRFNPGSQADQKVRVDVDPDLPSLKIENRLKTQKGSCRGYNAGIAIKVSNLPARDRIQLDGKHPSGCSNYRLSRTVLQADSYFFDLFKVLWEQLGGSIQGSYRSQALSIGEDEEPFMIWRSQPFREILTSTNKYSNNTMTRHLLLTLAAEEAGVPAKTEEGIQVIKTFLESRGMDTSNLDIQNGSGLSRDVRIDAQLMMDVLLDAYKSPNAAEFIASLPINGIDGTMRSRLKGKASEGMAHIKTGRLDHVVALAGIVQARDGKRYALVFMVNHQDAHRGVGNDIGDLLIDWLHNY